MKRLGVVPVVALISLPPAAAAQQLQRGEALYTQYCAACHEGPVAPAPSRDTLRSRSPEQIDNALSSWSMRRHAAALSPAERRAVAEFLSGRSAGSYRAPLEVIAKRAYCASPGAPADPLAGASWNGWSGDRGNTRFQPTAAAGIQAADVPRLKLKWSFGLPGVSASGSQMSIVGSRVFVGSRNGMVYSLDARSGCLVWGFEADAGVRSTPVVSRGDGTDTVYFGDAHAQVYALDAIRGTLKWKVKVETHLDAVITGGVVFQNGRVYVPVSSLEEASGVMPTYECCTFRGSVVALDAATGKQIWKTFTIAQSPERTTKSSIGTQFWGPSGGAIWSAPTLDPVRNRLYVTTGDSYSNPPAAESDAIMALAMDTGGVLWTRQTLPGDAWNIACLEKEPARRVNCPESAGPDYDFGSSPAVATLPGGRRVLLAGQKSGVLYGLNPDNGEVLWKTQVGAGGILGGIEWGFATDGAIAYVSLSSAFEKPAGEAGGLVAVNVADGKILWSVPPATNTCGGRPGCTSAQPAAVSAIPGVVFSGSLDGHLRAFDSATGKTLWDFNTSDEYDAVNGIAARGGSLNGPGATVAGGMVFVSSGYGTLGFMPGNVLLAFSVDGK